MKKNLQKILVLALGLTTTIASAQFSANSVSRIDNGDSDNRTLENRIALSADYGAVHVSSDVNASTDGSATSFGIYEAYASTDLMGFGTLTIGRQDLSFGSGALISSNSWGLNRYTQDGVSFAMNLGGFDVTLGSLGGVQYDNSNYMNASGNFGGADVNILMMNSGENKAHGYDLSYAMNNFTVSASMNSDFSGDEYTSYGLTYNVTDDLSASFGKTSYGESAIAEVLLVGTAQVDSTPIYGIDAANGGTMITGWNNDFVAASADYVAASDASSFGMDNTAMSGGLSNGVLGYLGSNDEMTSMGVSYDLGDITLSYTMHTISNDDTDADGNDLTPTDREASTMSLSYQLNDNCNISMSRFSDSSLETATDDGERNYLTISIGL